MEPIKQPFRTADVWLASFILFHGIDPQLEDLNGRVMFSFPATDAVYSFASDYNSGALVPLISYSEVHKALKGRMFIARGGER